MFYKCLIGNARSDKNNAVCSQCKFNYYSRDPKENCRLCP